MPRQSAPATDQPATAPPPAPRQTIVDLLNVRIVLVALVAMELVVIAALYPSFSSHRLQSRFREAYDAGQYEKALSALETLDRWYGRDYEEGDEKGLRALWESYRDISHNNRYLYYYYGADCLLRLGRDDEAWELLTNFDEDRDYMRLTRPVRNEARRRVPIMRGEIAWDRGDKAEAIPHFTEALRREPNDATANYYVGRHLFDQERYLEASFYLRHCAESDEYGAEAREMLAVIADKTTS